VRQGDCAGEVGGEDERALQDRDEDEVARRVVGADLGAELPNTLQDLPLGQVDGAGPRRAG
jgi:hypothetical protein